MGTDEKSIHAGNKIKVLIVDSLVQGRDLLNKALSSCNDIIIMGTAPTGSIGLMKARDIIPDVIILDVKIADIRPSELILKFLEINRELGIILITPYEPEKKIINETITCLRKGALDFIKRPFNLPEDQEVMVLQRRMISKIRIFSIRKYSRMARIASGAAGENPDTYQPVHHIVPNAFSHLKHHEDYDLVVIGVSTGGPEALSHILPALPPSFPVPIVIILHMPQFFTQSMAQELDHKSMLTVKEAGDGEQVRTGHVYLACGGKHLKVSRKELDQLILYHDDSPEVNGCKPSVDVFFNSVETVMKNQVIALILTGMGEDGVKGISRLKAKGAITIAQDSKTSIVWGMPGAAVRAGVIDEVLPLHGIADRLKELTGCV